MSNQLDGNEQDMNSLRAEDPREKVELDRRHFIRVTNTMEKIKTGTH